MKRTTICLSVLLALIFGISARAAGSTPQLVSVKVPLSQTVKTLLHGKFVQGVTCTRACKITARIFISPKVARRLGFKRVKPGVPFAIGLKQQELSAGKGIVITMPVSSEAKKRLRKVKNRLRLTGETYAQATTSSVRGQANWVTTLRR